ncbi:MAG: hypothetical protein HYX51_08460 [Chloroflexi bacterium]|nr:hypothetical protein [Chloroflexota bacterium]
MICYIRLWGRMSELLALPPSLRARMYATVTERARVLARVTPGTHIEEVDGMLMIGERDGVLYVLKTASVLRPPANPAAAVARALAFYDELGVSWSLDLPDEYVPLFTDVAHAAGLVSEGPDVGMVLFDHPGEKPLPRGLEIEVVRDAETLRVFSDTAGAGFGFAEGCTAAFLFATTMGRPVYERIGFRHALDYRTWNFTRGNAMIDPPIDVERNHTRR